MEEQAAEYIRNHVTKPVVAFIAGQSAPFGKNKWGMQELLSPELPVRWLKKKIEALEAAGIQVAQELSDIPALLKKQQRYNERYSEITGTRTVDFGTELNNMVDDEENNNGDYQRRAC